MSKVRKCSNCKRRAFAGWGGETEFCWGYETTYNEETEIETAADCDAYVEGTPDCFQHDDDDYCPSSTAGDYSPSCPWNAPGMSIRDFI